MSNKGKVSYSSFFSGSVAGMVFSAPENAARAMLYTFSAPGRIVGGALSMPATTGILGKIRVCALLEYGASTGSVIDIRWGATDLKNYNGPRPGFRNFYFNRPKRIVIGNGYRIIDLGTQGSETGIISGALATAPVTNGVITAPKETGFNGFHNSTRRAGGPGFPVEATTTAGDLVGLDVLFWGD